MATLKLEGVEKLEKRLIETERGWQDVHVAFKRAAIILYASIKRNFHEGGRPAWKELKYREGEILKDTGTLRNSIGGNGQADIHKESHAGNRHTLEIGTNVKYANVHQFGFRGSVNQRVKEHERKIRKHKRIQTMAWGRKMKIPRSVWVKAHTQHVKSYERVLQQDIPARPFLVLQAQDRHDIVQMFKEWYGQKFTGQ